MKVHETQPSEPQPPEKKDEIYSPIPVLQKIESGGVYKRNSFRLKGKPKGIKIIGFVLVGFAAICILFSIISNIFNL